MSRYRVLWVLFVVTVVGALSSGRALWWSFAGALLALIAIPLVWAWMSVNWLRISRHTLTRVAQVGETLDEEFVVHNLSRIPKLWLEVRDLSSLPGHAASRVTGFIGGQKWRGWRVSTFCLARGRYTLGPVVASSGDPLGIYQRARTIPKVSTILVYPATYEFRQFPLPAGYLPGGDVHRRRTHYVTTNAAGVRDYMNGDGINRIHWPITAKRQRLIVKEFELDPMSDLWILLDLHRDVQVVAEGATGGAAAPPAPFTLAPATEEYAISMAASIAKHFLRQNRALGLVAYGQHREALASDRGERQYDKIMEMLSVLRATGAVPFDRVLRAESASLARGSTVIVISPSQDMAWALMVHQLVRSGLRVVAIAVDAGSFGAPTSSDEIVGALAEAGAVVRVVRRGESLVRAIEQPAG